MRESASDVLRWSLDAFEPEQLVLAASFGAEDVVLLDLLHEIGRFPRVITLDTGRLHRQTYDLIEELRRKYRLSVEFFCPDAGDLEQLIGGHGPNLFYESVELRQLCCEVRKRRPLRRALAGCRAWITGLRREQSPARAAVTEVEWDGQFGLLKISPLAHWTAAEVWGRIRERGVPYNRLHDEGYPSIGCAPCTRAVASGEDERSGRWWWEKSTSKECGLHPPR